MKILWVNPHFLHPTTKGGQIRTLEMLRHLHRWHEIHYVALVDTRATGDAPEGLARSPEYSTRAYAIPHRLPERGSLAFIAQSAGNLFSDLPLAVSRYQSAAMRNKVQDLVEHGGFDRLVCDFLFAAPNVPDLEHSVLFQHNVESTIWQRHSQNAGNPAAKAFFSLQAKRMVAYEDQVCRRSGHIIAVSTTDADRMREMFGVSRVSDVPTGVDLDYFAPVETGASHSSDLVFVGSMDWLPNIDAVQYFVADILPLIRKTKPDCTVAIVGRKPQHNILALAKNDPGIIVTGTVPDVRPYFWGSSISIVPLRIGGGTRLKIYEAMAARSPVVSTTVGAEGLPISSGETCYLADDPQDFADRCLELLADEDRRKRMAQAAWELVSTRFSWEHASRRFEQILENAPAVTGS